MARKFARKIISIGTKYGVFRCIFEHENDMGGYSVEAKGVPGAISWGRNLSQAKRMIMEAIEGAVEASAVAQAEKKGIVKVKSNRHPALIA